MVNGRTPLFTTWKVIRLGIEIPVRKSASAVHQWPISGQRWRELPVTFQVVTGTKSGK
jgi:hypothetical protein